MRAPPLPAALGAASAALAVVVLCLAMASRAEAPRVWLELAEPVAGSVLMGPVPLVLVRGFASVGESTGDDVVILLDTSVSTLDAAGFDVDGDGRVGRRLPSADDPLRSWNPRRACSDPGDTIRAAEIQAARAWLARAKDTPRMRIALATVNASSVVVAAPGATPAALDRALAELGESFASPAGSDLAAGLDLASDLLRDRAAGRLGSVLVLSDGRAERAGATSERARSELLEAAGRLADQEVAVHAFVLGRSGGPGATLLAEVTRRTGGSSVAVSDASVLPARVAALELGAVAELEVENANAEGGSRALRLLPNGRFDAVVPLAPGENRIVVRARAEGAGEQQLERVVHFEPREARTLDEARAVAADLDALRTRTLELEMAAAVERGRAQARRRLLELEAAGP